MSQRSGPAGPSGPTTIVYKLGGSLLTLPDLGRRLQGVLPQQQDNRPLLVVGGGPAADLVREWDRVHQLGEERAHRLALGSMTLNESLVLELLPETRSVTTRDAAEEAWPAAQLPVLRVQQFLNNEEKAIRADGSGMRSGGDEEMRRGETPHPLIASSPHPLSPVPPLPHTWDVTSDSIAAWIALRWPADELVLLKSCPLPEATDPARLQEWVDPYFPHLAPHLPRIGWINLRDEEPRLQPCFL